MQFILNTLHLANGGSTDSDTDDCKCVVHQTFYGKLSSTVTCDSCRNVTTAQDPYMDLSLDIRNHKKRKLNNDKGDEVLDLRDCLERFTAKEKLGSAEYTCRNCDKPQNATKQLSIKRVPPVLAVHLKVCTFSLGTSSKTDHNSASSTQKPSRPRSRPESAFPPSWISTPTPLHTSKS